MMDILYECFEKDPDDKKKEESEELLRKWAGPLLLGPLLPAIFAMITVIGGTIVLQEEDSTSCGENIDSFITGAVVVSYLFLMVYFWVWFGCRVEAHIPYTSIRFVVALPYSKVWLLALVYTALFIASMSVWGFGTSVAGQWYLCQDTTPRGYAFANFLVTIYWIGFCVVLIMVFSLLFGDRIKAGMAEATKDPSADEVERRMFKKAAKKFDPQGTNRIATDDLDNYLPQVGIELDEAGLRAVKRQLDHKDEGYVELEEIIAWAKSISADDDGDLDSLGSGAGSDEEEDTKKE